MTSLKEPEICTDVLQRIRFVIKEAAIAYRDKTKRTFQESDENLLFKSMCDALIAKRRTDTRLILESQLTAYDFVMDFAVKGRKISEPWICKLHSLICGQIHGAPKGRRVEEQPFPIGQYRHSPNKIVWQRGRSLFGAPAKSTSAEMFRYRRELCSRAFLEAHPILQASYAHYALVTIHPFADGNGRIARLLALIFIYRSNTIPALSLSQDRVKYKSALRAADMGDFHPFINLVQESSIDSATQIQQRILSALQQT